MAVTMQGQVARTMRAAWRRHAVASWPAAGPGRALPSATDAPCARCSRRVEPAAVQSRPDFAQKRLLHTSFRVRDPKDGTGKPSKNSEVDPSPSRYGSQPFPPPAPENVPEEPDSGPTESVGGPAVDTYDSLFSSSYRGQSRRARGSPRSDETKDRRDQKPWYRSPTTLILGFIPVFTFGLGYWQIKRLKWKLSLIEELEDKLRREPMRLPRKINVDALDEFAFRLVEVEGTFDNSRPIFVGPRVREGVMGYHLVVPLLRPDGQGDALLVNRGFISEKELEGQGMQRRLKHAPGDGELLRPTRVLALLPRVYPPNAFTPPNKPANNEWFHVNAAEMAQYYNDVAANSAAPPTAPVYLEEIFAGNAGEAAARVQQGVPVGRAPTIELRNQHAVYAATWFSLSAATAVMFGLLVRRGR